MGRYSAAWRVVSAVAFRTPSIAAMTRSSNPGLSGTNLASISLGNPACSVAAKKTLRRARNFAASKGLAKSATCTDQRLSYAAHSGDMSSGLPNSASVFAGIESTLPFVRLAQGNDPQRIATQNKYHNVQARANHRASTLAFFAVVVPVVGKELDSRPVNVRNTLKRDAVPAQICSRFARIPFKRHAPKLNRRMVNNSFSGGRP